MRGAAMAAGLVAAFVLAVAILTPSAALAEKQEQLWRQIQELGWQFDGRGRIGQQATVEIRTGSAFLNSADTRRFLELQQNLPRDDHYLIAPDNLRWFAVFYFEPIGYVQDDEKIDADDLLRTLQRQNESVLQERRNRGLPGFFLDGWHVPPHYDAQTKRLEWGTRLHNDRAEVTINYMIKLLGRDGVMNALLVSEPASLDTNIREFKDLLTGLSFNAGRAYAEFRSGDKIAEYGLAALIVGGAAATAAKSGAVKGLLKFGWVAIVGIGLGVIALVKKVLGRA
jgi:uncharacterized membrane-anchored protein